MSCAIALDPAYAGGGATDLHLLGTGVQLQFNLGVLLSKCRTPPCKQQNLATIPDKGE